MTGGLSVEGSPEIFVYIKGTKLTPQSILFVSRINLADGSEMTSVRDLHRYTLRNMSLTQEEFDELLGEGGVEMKEHKIGAFEALEMNHSGTGGPLGVEQPATHAMTVLGGDFIVVVMLMTMDGESAEETYAWESIVASLDVDPTAALIRKILLYGGIALVALIMLLFVKRVRRGSALSAQATRRGSYDNGIASEGWGRKVAPPTDLPGAGTSPTTARPGGTVPQRSKPRTLPSAAPSPVGAGASNGVNGMPTASRVPATVGAAGSHGAPPGLSRSGGASSAPSPLGSSSGTAGGPPSSPPAPRGPTSGPPSVGAASQPAPSTPGPESPAEDEPARGGLRSTLPPSGRWGK